MAKKKKGNKKPGGYQSPQKTSPQQEEPKCSTWKQDNTKVTFIVELPRRPSSIEDVDTEFTNTTASVSLKGGLPWKCRFFGDIRCELTSISLQSTRLIVCVTKKESGYTWKQLDMPEEQLKTEKDITNRNEARDNGSKENTKKEDVDATKNTDPTQNQEEDTKSDGSEQNEEMEKQEESVYDLNHVKHDCYEKGNSTMVVHVYVKQTSSVSVAFHDKNVTVKFKTGDAKFLSMHEGTDSNTTFSWFINVLADLNTDVCKFRVSSTNIELMLQKKEAKKWSTLEAQLKQPSSGKLMSNTWTSTAKSASGLDAGKDKTQNVKSKVAFDEMGDGKEKQDVPEKESKMAANKGAMAGDVPDSSSQKPTCMVSPLKENSDFVVRPGMTGLDNLGNTCFMNSVLQVLVNTRELRDYFLESQFQPDINTDNPLGSGGKLAISYAVLLKILWSGKHYSYSPSKLKNLVAQKASQFSGYAQHDAQEFMAFLLDGLHEDLNRIKKKPYTETVDSDGRPDELVASEAWSVHKKRNDSFIVDHFQGQYKSKLTCPVCSKVSITFDPFMIVPVPMPKKQRLLPVIFMSKDPHRKPVKYMLRLPRDATVEILKKAVSELTGVHPRDMRVFQTYKRNIHQFFGKGSSLSSVNPADTIIVSEVLSEKVAGETVYEIAVSQRVLIPQTIPTICSYCRHECAPDSMLKRCTRCYKTAYCDRQCQASDWQSRHRTRCKLLPEVIAEPFMLSIPASQATYSRLVQMLEAFSRHSIDVFQPPVTDSLKNKDTDKCPNDADTSEMDNSDCALDNRNVDNVSPTPSATFSEDASTTNESTCSSLQSEAFNAESESKLDEKEKNDCDEAEKSDDSSSPKVPTRYVMGRQRDLVFVEPPFHLKPTDKDGRGLSDSEGRRLQDQGEDPLDLTNVYYLSMDWKNSEKCKPYVMVQSKELECEEDKSMKTMSLEEQREIGLDQCLDMFTEPEVLNPEESWYCPKCKEHREATKQLSIWRLPSTLIIQLKRFSFRNFIWRDKIDKMVEFPTRGLDMSRFYIGNRPANEPPPIYDLYGVINHYGGILGGHYTAYARTLDLHNPNVDEQGWRLFDDSHVSNTSEKQVVTRSAYVLFYRRRQYKVDIPVQINEVNKSDQETEMSASSVCDNEEEKSEVPHVPNVDLLTASQGIKQKSGNKPTSTMTASEAKRQALKQSKSENDSAYRTVNTKDDLCASTTLNKDIKSEASLDELNMDNNINSGILPLNVDNKVMSSENSSDYTDMDAVD